MSDDDLDNKTRTYVTLTSGTMVSHYRIIEKIGAGGMGEVYLAEDPDLNRKVALKFLPLHHCQDADCRMRFKREAQAVAKLNHPNIVTIHEVGDFNSRPYIAMEYIEGATLLNYRASGSPGEQELLLLCFRIAVALQAAHEQGIIHRDIKPANILVTSDGQPKILDFGLARLAGNEGLTQEHTVLGTLSYMSPEQIQGNSVDYRSDIFSLGVVLYELLAGIHPFKADYEAAVTYNVVHQTFRWPAAEVSREFSVAAPILEKALQKSPRDRYQSMAELAVDIEKSIAGSTQKSQRRRIGMSLLLGATTVVLAVALVMILWPSRKNEIASPLRAKRLLVIPFMHLGPPEQAYVASGITSELMSTLVSFGGVSVVPRLTAEQCRDSSLKLEEIGRRLGVQFVLDGTVQWQPQTPPAPARVRVIVELVDVDSAGTLWSERYDTTAEQLLDIQSDIVEKVAYKIGALLVEGGKGVVGAGGTHSQEAHDYVLRGNEYTARDMRVSSENAKYALEMYDRAIQLDSGYAYAYAQKSKALLAQHRCEEAQAAALHCLVLSPNLPAGNEALGLFYAQCKQDWSTALHYWDVAYNHDRDNVDYLDLTAQYFCQAGQWAKAYDNYARAVKLEPNSAQLQSFLAATCLWLRRYDEADAAADKTIALRPDFWLGYYVKAMACLLRDGNTTRARPVVTASARLVKADDQWWLYQVRCWADLIDGNFKEALGEAANAPFGTENWETGMLYFDMGKADLMRARFDAAATSLGQALIRGEGARTRANLAVALAATGHGDSAILLGQQALAQQPSSAWELSLHWNQAVVYTMLGSTDAAIAQLDTLLREPGPYSLALLRHDPTFASLRSNPKYALLTEAHY